MPERLCKDCRWANGPNPVYGMLCTHEKSRRTYSDLVDGRFSPEDFYSCAIQRAYECGPAGRYFTPDFIEVEVVKDEPLSLPAPSGGETLMTLWARWLRSKLG